LKLALLRHGPTEWNALGKVQGHIDIPLSNEGLAKIAALRLPIAAPRLYASPLLRARQTVEALGLKDPVLDARLMERTELETALRQALQTDRIETVFRPTVSLKNHEIITVPVASDPQDQEKHAE